MWVDNMLNIGFTMADLEYFLMILVRIATFIYIAPFFGTSNTPWRVKIGLSIFTSVILFQILPKETISYSTEIEYAVIILKEGITGLLIGFAANICNSIILFSGRIIDMEIGLSMATMFDPVSRQQTTISGTLYYYFVLLMLMITNMHHYLLRAITDTYKLIPIGKMVIDYDQMYVTALAFMTDFIVIGFRIVFPIFAVILITNTILGILAKVAPQLNMFVVGMQLKVLSGLSVMFLTIGLLPGISDFIFTEMKRMIVAVTTALY